MVHNPLEHAVLLYRLQKHGYQLEPAINLWIPEFLLPGMDFSTMLIRTVKRHPEDDIVMGLPVALYNSPQPNLMELLQEQENPTMVQKLGYVLDGIATAYQRMGLVPSCQSELQQTIAALEEQKRRLNPTKTIFFSPEAERFSGLLIQDEIGKKWDVADDSKIQEYMKALELYVLHAHAPIVLKISTAGTK